jgi:hypothetical protein
MVVNRTQPYRIPQGKTNGLMFHLLTAVSHLICQTEHHFKNFEMFATPNPKYKLRSKYCRMKLKMVVFVCTSKKP